MKKKRKPKPNASLQERIEARINDIRIQIEERETDTLKTVKFMLLFGLALISVCSIVTIVHLWQGIVAGNPPIWNILSFWFIFTLICIAFLWFVKKVGFDNRGGRVVQGNALSKWTKLARVSRGSFLRYSLGEKLSKLWEHGDPIAIVACTIGFSVAGLGLVGAGCRAIANQHWLVGIGLVIFGLFFLSVLILTLRYKWNELKPPPKPKSMLRKPPKTVVEIEQFPLVIGEENRFFIRQYCKKRDEFFGCNVKISLVLAEEEVYAGQYNETRQRVERLVHEHQFDSETGNTRYELLFTAPLPAEEYVPTTRAHFISAHLRYEWYLRVRIYSKNGTLLSRDFPVVLVCGKSS